MHGLNEPLGTPELDGQRLGKRAELPLQGGAGLQGAHDGCIGVDVAPVEEVPLVQRQHQVCDARELDLSGFF